MPRSKPRPTFEEHVELGRRLKFVRDELIQITTQLSGHYPTTNPVTGMAHKAAESVDRLRSKLDDVSLDDLRGQEVWSPEIYYPGTKK